MATKKGSSIWPYFIKTDEPSKVKCKICKKHLGALRTFNLKKHLTSMHKLEIRLSRKRGLQHNDSERKTGTSTSSYSLKNPGVSVKNEAILDPENLLEISNKNATVNETETREQCNVDDANIDINPKTIISTHDDVSALILPAEVSTNDEEMIDPLSKSNENGWVMMEDSTISSNLIDYEAMPKTKSRPKSIIISADNLDDPTFRLKEDSFEEMFKKKKLSLELECLEMHNYKIKLEIWEIEQKLQLQSSKFTKNITARRKKTENNE